MILNRILFDLPKSEIKQYGIENLTYGSLTQKGIERLSKELNPLIKNAHGLDLGCGDGELIYHLQNAMPDSVWEGVEISEHRVNQNKRDVSIWQGDMLLESFRPYNILHSDNLCLEESIAEELEKKIAIEFKGLFLTYREPQNFLFLKRARFIKSVLTETTWANHFIHFYEIS
jgi:tRNA G46 methylase TrmB